MRKQVMILAAAVMAFSAPAVSYSAMEHGDHSRHASGPAYEEVVDGVKISFTVQTMKDAMKEMGMEMPKGVKETHHISVSIKDVKSGKQLTEGEIKLKIQSPDKKDQTKDLMGMRGHFGGDFEMPVKGKYGVMSKFKLKDGKIRQAKFWYTVK